MRIGRYKASVVVIATRLGSRRRKFACSSSLFRWADVVPEWGPGGRRKTVQTVASGWCGKRERPRALRNSLLAGTDFVFHSPRRAQYFHEVGVPAHAGALGRANTNNSISRQDQRSQPYLWSMFQTKRTAGPSSMGELRSYAHFVAGLVSRPLRRGTEPLMHRANDAEQSCRRGRGQ